MLVFVSIPPTQPPASISSRPPSPHSQTPSIPVLVSPHTLRPPSYLAAHLHSFDAAYHAPPRTNTLSPSPRTVVYRSNASAIPDTRHWHSTSLQQCPTRVHRRARAPSRVLTPTTLLSPNSRLPPNVSLLRGFLSGHASAHTNGRAPSPRSPSTPAFLSTLCADSVAAPNTATAS